MAACSKKKEDVMMWLQKVVESCTTSEHFESALKLIWQFESSYNITIDDELTKNFISKLKGIVRKNLPTRIL